MVLTLALGWHVSVVSVILVDGVLGDCISNVNLDIQGKTSKNATKKHAITRAPEGPFLIARHQNVDKHRAHFSRMVPMAGFRKSRTFHES